MKPLNFDKKDIISELFVHDIDNPEEVGGGKDLYMCHIMVQTENGVSSVCHLISSSLDDLKNKRKFFNSLKDAEQKGFSHCAACKKADAFEKYKSKFR